MTAFYDSDEEEGGRQGGREIDLMRIL